MALNQLCAVIWKHITVSFVIVAFICKTYDKMEIAPPETAQFVAEAISGANRILRRVGLLACYLIHLCCHEVEVEVALHHALLQHCVQSWGPVGHIEL